MPLSQETYDPVEHNARFERILGIARNMQSEIAEMKVIASEEAPQSQHFVGDLEEVIEAPIQKLVQNLEAITARQRTGLATN